MNFTARVDRVEPSATLAIGTRASELRAAGTDVVNLSVGEPDFGTPENIVTAAHDAMVGGHTGYTPSAGIPELREVIAAKARNDGIVCGSDDIIVTPGAKQALYEATQTLVEDGDEVILLDPAWVSYEAMVKLASGTLRRVDLSKYDFRLEPAIDELTELIADDTRLLILNSPSNPTGVVYSDTALRGIRDLAVDHDITVISDEIYDRISYGVDPTSIGSIADMAERTVTVNGFSKTYSMTGWRLGYLIGPSEFIAQASKLHSHSVSCAVNFVQHAGIEALTNTDDAVEEMVAAFEHRRDVLIALLADHGVAVPTIPTGAFYMMIPVDGDDEEWCFEALTDAHVAAVPGSAFGAPGYVRISYANNTDRLKEAITRLSSKDLL